MIRLVRAEWTKLFTTRVWIGLLLGACVMVGGFAALFTGFAGADAERSAGHPAGRRPGSSSSWRFAVGDQRHRAVPDPRHHRDDPGVPAPDGDADLPDQPAARAGGGRQAGGLRAGRRPVRAGRASPSTCWSSTVYAGARGAAPVAERRTTCGSLAGARGSRWSSTR